MTDLSALSRFRTDRGPVAVLPPPAVRSDRHCTLLAFDPALANVGWAEVRVNGAERVVMATGHFKTDPISENKGGFEDSFQRGVMLAKQYRSVMRSRAFMDGLIIVQESPSIMGPKASQRAKEGPIVAGTALRVVADECGLRVVMIQAQFARHELGLSKKATKAEVKRYVLARFPDLPSRNVGPLNEHTYDAIVVALGIAEKDW